ncbi:MAG: DUF6088 family protein [Bacteroides stercoris]
MTAIKAKGRGSIFFPSDFTSYGEVKAIGKSLERLTAKGDIIRLARGIYLYPEIDTVLGLGILMPSIEQIAEMIARRDKARIVPTGIYALNKLGISTQVPMNIVYLTDGAPRKVSLWKWSFDTVQIHDSQESFIHKFTCNAGYVCPKRSRER